MLQSGKQRGIILRAQCLPPYVFVDIRSVAECAPVRRDFRAISKVPREMVRSSVDEQEQGTIAMFARNDVGRLVEIKAVTLEPTRAQIFHIEVALDSGGRLKAA